MSDAERSLPFDNMENSYFEGAKRNENEMRIRCLHINHILVNQSFIGIWLTTAYPRLRVDKQWLNTAFDTLTMELHYFMNIILP